MNKTTTIRPLTETIGKSIRRLSLLLLVAAGSFACASPVNKVHAEETVGLRTPDLVSTANENGMHMSEALASDKPTLIFFAPVEMCQIRYCLTPDLMAKELGMHYQEQVNLVVAPVYAVDTPDKPDFPIVDWGVYLVEPYANWVPDLTQTEFGWGLEESEVVLVGAEGTVLYRSNGSLSVAELSLHIEQPLINSMRGE